MNELFIDYLFNISYDNPNLPFHAAYARYINIGDPIAALGPIDLVSGSVDLDWEVRYRQHSIDHLELE